MRKKERKKKVVENRGRQNRKPGGRWEAHPHRRERRARWGEPFSPRQQNPADTAQAAAAQVGYR